jgi:hypothetical protein
MERFDMVRGKSIKMHDNRLLTKFILVQNSSSSERNTEKSRNLIDKRVDRLDTPF